MSDPKPTPHQDELPLSSFSAHHLFPGRKTLYVWEVARALSVTEQHVINLCEQGEMDEAFNVGSGSSKSQRNYWRIPVTGFDAFVAKRKNV